MIQIACNYFTWLRKSALKIQTEETPVSKTKKICLSNTDNIKQLIPMLIKTITNTNQISVEQASVDADKLIVDTAIEGSKELKTTIVYITSRVI